MTETELLKSLVGYLPYGLKGLFETRDVMPATSRSETRIKTLKVDNVEFFIKYCVPILYPLSSLTEELANQYGYISSIDLKWDIINQKVEARVWNDLLKGKWDVYNLIESGHAISVKELKTNPYE